MGSWTVVRGVTTNRIRGGRKIAASSPNRGARTRSTVPIRDASPQRAKLSQRSRSPRELWTTISISIRVTDLLAIDARADELGLSRSRFMTEAALK